jgi:AraC-like DNA-binding protein
LIGTWPNLAFVIPIFCFYYYSVCRSRVTISNRSISASKIGQRSLDAENSQAERDIVKNTGKLIDWEMPGDEPTNPFRCVDALPDCAEHVEPGDLTTGSRGDPKDKILCVERGRLRLEGPHGEWHLLPAHMVFVPHSRPYRLCTSADASISVAHLGAQHTMWQHDGCWTAPVSGLAREMLGYALRWGRERASDDTIANSYFATLGMLCKHWFECSRMMWIPFGESPALKRAIAYARTRLDSVTIELAAEAAGMSVRTLRRHFQDELGMSWRRFLQALRMTRAIELLTHNRLSVTQTALEVGFESAAAFRLAFATFTGKTPSSYARDFLDNPSTLSDESQPGIRNGSDQENALQCFQVSPTKLGHQATDEQDRGAEPGSVSKSHAIAAGR